MRLKTGKRLWAAIVSGSMFISCMPSMAMAEEPSPSVGSLTAVFSEAAVGHESVLMLTAESDFNGTKEVRISDYMPKQEYVSDGLVLQLDGIDNTGTGEHSNQSEYWTDLTSGTQIAINRENKEEKEGTNSFTDTALQLNASKVYLPDKAAQAVNGDAYTVELVTDSQGYSGYERRYSPLMTVDETADSWSIFVRDIGKTMELKQGVNSVRLRTEFANVFDTTSAVVFQKNMESAWYAGGEKKDTFVSGNNAAAQKVILGGRLKDNNGNVSNEYVTSASYHAVRIYNRALSEAELQHNAALDRKRYYGEAYVAPDVIINSIPLSVEGVTSVTAEFENGVARIPVLSREEGTVPLTIEVEGLSCSAELVTKDVVDLAVGMIPDSVHLTGVADTAAQSVIRELVKEQAEAALKDSFFIQDGGSIAVSGTESPYRLELTLGEKTRFKSVAVTIEYADSTDMDILKKAMTKIQQGEFVFDQAEEVTAEALQQQIQPNLEEDITAEVVWDEGKKCYELTLMKGSENLTYPLYVNSEVSISEFTEEFLQNCTMRRGENTSIEVNDGAVCVRTTQNMTYENIVLPVFTYGRDYMLSVDLKVKDSTDNARWSAMSYGVASIPNAGDNAWSFWQMAVRRNATAGNGVECAERTTGDTWSVHAAGSYTENLDPDTVYNLKIVIKGMSVYEYINDQLIVKYESQEKMKYGKVAFSFDRVTAEYSNFVMTSEIPENLETIFPKTENGYDTDLYEPDTGLVMAPVVVNEKEETTMSELTSGKRRPSTVIRTVSENMTVLDAGQEITLADYVERADKKVLAGFRIESMDAANAFADYVKENHLVDIMVVAKEPDILLTACGRRAGIHGMLDVEEYVESHEADIFELVCKANEANSRILVLPQQLATKENIQYIQSRAIAVWVKTEEDQLSNVILNGADGIITDDFETVYDVIEGFSASVPVLNRGTVIAAHRGIHLAAPENSLRAAKAAVEAGADAIECDVHLTKDGEVVVNHDETTGRLMNKDLTIADSTLAELRELKFLADAQEGDKIPTLQELFLAADEADPDDDIIHVIEIKAENPNVIEPMVKIIKEMNMEDRVLFISFHDDQLKRIRQAMPNVAAGELNGLCSAADDVAEALKKLCSRMDAYGYFYNCNYGSQNIDIVRAARFRGIYIHPWTVDDINIFESEYINNYHGITTNRADYAKDYLNRVETGENAYSLQAGDEAGVVVETKVYTRSGAEIEGARKSMKQISGVPVSYDPESGKCFAEEKGEAEVVFGASYRLAATGKTYMVYSAPVKLTVEPSDKEMMQEILKKVQAAEAAAQAAEEEARKAQTVSETAAERAEEARIAAEAAQEKAKAAQKAAEAIESVTGEDKKAAEAAAEAAEAAARVAKEAQEKAEAAKEAAELSAEKAEGAGTAAETARTAAEDAQKAAETAGGNAQAAAGQAEAAQKTAEAAKEAAQKAREDAEDAAGLAEAARTAAETAKEAAEAEAGVAQAAREAAETAAKAAKEDRVAAEAARKEAETVLQNAKAEAAKQRAEAEKELERAEEVLEKMNAMLAKASFENTKIKLKKLKNGKNKQIRVFWKKVKDAEGYVIQYAVKSSFKGKKTITVRDGKAAEKDIRKLVGGKKYFVRIKAYRTVNGEKIFTGYSKRKSIRVK